MKADPIKSISDTDDNLSSLNTETVAKYLLANPEFFIGQEDLLRSLSFPHETGGAISLVERQVKLLREHNSNTQGKLDKLLTNARENDALFEKIRLVVLTLLRSSTLDELSATIATTLSTNFSACISKLVFISDTADTRNNMISLATAKQVFGDLFDKKRTVCGPLEAHQAALLFPVKEDGPLTAEGSLPVEDSLPAEGSQLTGTVAIISAAIVPIHLDKASSADELGIPMLIIGSDKAQNFNSSLDTLFLDFIGEVLSVHIAHLYANER